MKKDNLDTLFNNLQGKLDTCEPNIGHQQRFLDKLEMQNSGIVISKKNNTWWKPLSIAASIAIICSIFFYGINSSTSTQNQIAEIAPEVSNSKVYFASLIEYQIKELEKQSSPKTQKIIDDTLNQLNSLQLSYNKLEQDLIAGGNSNLILKAMITNFQTRIDLLQDVLNQIEISKNINHTNDENFTI